MRARLAQSVSPFLLLTTSLLTPSALAQISPCLERRLPIPSLADEIRQRKAEAPKQVVSIESVAFEGEFDWPKPIRAEITGKLKQSRFDASTDWVAEIKNQARAALQDRGYFQSMLRATVKVLLDDPLQPRVSVTFKEDHLERFWLEEVHIRNAKENDPKLVFPRDQLRALIPIRSGEIFNTQKIRQGMDAMRRLYATKGYIDFTPNPSTDIDTPRHRISLTFELDEQKQFLIEKVEIFGLNPALERNLRSKVKLGDPLNWSLVEGFFKANKSVLPPEVSLGNVRVDRDLKKGTVELLFDFRPCPRYDPPPIGELPEPISATFIDVKHRASEN